MKIKLLIGLIFLTAVTGSLYAQTSPQAKAKSAIEKFTHFTTIDSHTLNSTAKILVAWYQQTEDITKNAALPTDEIRSELSAANNKKNEALALILSLSQMKIWLTYVEPLISK